MSPLNPATVLLPMLVVVALTIVAFGRMAVARAGAAKAKAGEPDYYRAFQGPPEPEYAIVAVRHYGNLFEAPVLFYAGCISLFVLNAVSPLALVLAWGYSAARVVQSLVHLTFNNPIHRGGAFVLGWLFLIALWVDIALKVAAAVTG